MAATSPILVRRRARAVGDQQTKSPLLAYSGNVMGEDGYLPDQRCEHSASPLARPIDRATRRQPRRRGPGQKNGPHRVGCAGSRRSVEGYLIEGRSTPRRRLDEANGAMSNHARPTFCGPAGNSAPKCRCRDQGKGRGFPSRLGSTSFCQ